MVIINAKFLIGTDMVNEEPAYPFLSFLDSLLLKVSFSHDNGAIF